MSVTSPPLNVLPSASTPYPVAVPATWVPCPLFGLVCGASIGFRSGSGTLPTLASYSGPAKSYPPRNLASMRAGLIVGWLVSPAARWSPSGLTMGTDDPGPDGGSSPGAACAALRLSGTASAALTKPARMARRRLMRFSLEDGQATCVRAALSRERGPRRHDGVWAP